MTINAAGIGGNPNGEFNQPKSSTPRFPVRPESPVWTLAARR